MEAMLIQDFEGLVSRPSSPELQRMRRDCLRMFEAALAAANAGKAVKSRVGRRGETLIVDGLEIDLETLDSRRMIAFGKASLPMAEALLGVVDIDEGLVVTHEKSRWKRTGFRILRGGHPHPDEGSLEAGRAALEIANRCGASDLLLVLVSGGGSSLLEDTPIPLEELRAVSDLMFLSGMDIVRQNTVRKHLSNLKGGQLAQAAASRGATVVGLIVSDVVGDPLSFIASGPTVPDESTYQEAKEILETYRLWHRLPDSARSRLELGSKGELPETPGAKDPAFQRVHNVLVAKNRLACEAAATEGEKRGYHAVILTSQLQGEAREVAKVLMALARSLEGRRSLAKSPSVLISGGETTVSVRGRGTGGRNQELVLAAVPELRGRRIVLLSAGTDGRDGLTDAAGAIADGESSGRSSLLNLDPLHYLARNDSHAFFREMGDTVVTGPTGTNVMDIQVIVVA